MQADWFGGRLKELREQAGLTQEHLAGQAGLTKDAVARIERGNRSPTWETVVALCVALGVKCDAFMQAPADRPAQGRGRPRKATAESGERSAGKGKPRSSKPRKGPRQQ